MDKWSAGRPESRPPTDPHLVNGRLVPVIGDLEPAASPGPAEAHGSAAAGRQPQH